MSAPSHADWINLTGAENAPNIAEIYIMDDHIRVVMEIYWNDVEKFKPLTVESFSAIEFITDDDKRLKLNDIPVLERRMRIDRYSPFKNLGTTLPGATVMSPPDDKRVYYAELIFALPEHIDTLTIVPVSDNKGNAFLNIGFLVYHKKVPVIDFRFLSGNEVLHLDWDDPWYTRFDNPNLNRHHQAALSSYVYVEPYEVRHEILIRPRDLAYWMELELADERYIQANEFQPLLQRVGEFLSKQNPVSIDGQAGRPILDRMDYITMGLYGIQNIKPVEKMELNSAVIGVMFSYLTSGMPKQVSMKWDLFNEKIQQVPSTVSDPAGPFLSYLSPDDSTLIWDNFLKNFSLPEVERVPVLSVDNNSHFIVLLFLVLIVLFIVLVRLRRNAWSMALASSFTVVVIAFVLLAGNILHTRLIVKPLAHDEASLILQTLLKNIYSAFHLHNEEDVYDKLALTVNGNLLEQVYLQQRQSFAVENAGGAQAKVDNVELLDVLFQEDSATADSLAYRARWTAEGAVSHWGHTHNRKNLYEAMITISTIANTWKVTDLKILEEKRLLQSVDKPPVPVR